MDFCSALWDTLRACYASLAYQEMCCFWLICYECHDTSFVHHMYILRHDWPNQSIDSPDLFRHLIGITVYKYVLEGCILYITVWSRGIQITLFLVNLNVALPHTSIFCNNFHLCLSTTTGLFLAVIGMNNDPLDLWCGCKHPIM